MPSEWVQLNKGYRNSSLISVNGIFSPQEVSTYDESASDILASLYTDVAQYKYFISLSCHLEILGQDE